ncbi:MAG TPA: DciA family protein [Blastocatellia bacterium]|nr:DciA family protein [Blastocatellia bacterium]
MNSLLKMLPTMIRFSGDHEEVREQAAFVAWRAVAGPQVAYNCIPFRLYQKHLVIAVLDLAWKKQMERLSGQYLFRINSLLGGAYVTFIEFRIDRKTVLGSRPPDEKRFEFHHTEEIEAELRSAADRIKDDPLREQFLRAAAKCLERREMGSGEWGVGSGERG